MRFQALYRQHHETQLQGTTTAKGSRNRSSFIETDCHEFTISDVDCDTNKIFPNQLTAGRAKVTYIAGKYPKDNLYGPASSMASKSIIYPCSYNRCRVDCQIPCQLCFQKSPHCKKMQEKKPVETAQSAELTTKTTPCFTVLFTHCAYSA